MGIKTNQKNARQKIEKIKEEIKEVKELQRQYNEKESRNVQKIINVAAGVSAIAALTGTGAIAALLDDGNYSFFNHYIKTQEYRIESVSNQDSSIINNYETSVGIDHDDTITMTIEAYSNWYQKDGHYFRDVATYEIESTEDIIDSYKNNIKEINMSELECIEYKTISSYQQESYTISEEELNKGETINMSIKYKNRVIDVPKKALDYLTDIGFYLGGTLGIGAVSFLVLLIIVCPTASSIIDIIKTRSFEKDGHKKMRTFSEVLTLKRDAIEKLRNKNNLYYHY